MMTEPLQTANATNGNTDKNRAPGKGDMGAGGIAIITIYLFGAILVIMLALIVLWPPLKPKPDGISTPSPSPSPSATVTQTQPVPASNSATTTRTAAGAGTTTTGTQANPTTSPAATVSPSATPSPTATPFKNGIKGEYCYDEDGNARKGVSPLRFRSSSACMYDEDRLLLIVLLAGAFGSLIHGLRSFVWYVGNRRAVWSWSAYYFALPFIGSGLAFIFYLVIRGGFFSPGAPTELTSPVGFAAVAALIGMFTEQAVQKLKGVSETILSPAEKGKDHIGGPNVTGISPKQGPVAGGNQVTIAGENFSTPVTVKFGTAEATVGADSTANSITVTAPPVPDGKPQTVDVLVINSDAQQINTRAAYEYKDGADGAEQPVPGEGSDDDSIEGCDVQLKLDTPDEALPITEGGVE